MPYSHFAGINASRLVYAALSVALAAPGVSHAQSQGGVLGYWSEPGGSVIHVEACGGGKVCAALVEISQTAPARVDGLNPDASLRKRTLCGVRIGTDFDLVSPDKADHGTVYDPKSGKTYHGTMTSTGDQLKLRGFIGVALFGRTETWTRTKETKTCTK